MIGPGLGCSAGPRALRFHTAALFGPTRNIGEGRVVENIRDGVTHVQHHQAEAAGLFIGAHAPLVGNLADAPDWGKRAVQRTHNLPQGDLVGGTREVIAAAHSEPAVEQARILEGQEDLLKELDGNLFPIGDLSDLDDIVIRIA